MAITNPTRYVLAEMHRCCNEGGGGDKTKAPSVSLVTIRRLGIGTGGDGGGMVAWFMSLLVTRLVACCCVSAGPTRTYRGYKRAN